MSADSEADGLRGTHTTTDFTGRKSSMSTTTTDEIPEVPCDRRDPHDGHRWYMGSGGVEMHCEGICEHHDVELLFPAQGEHPTAITCVDCGWNGTIS